jgi:hypothetical protein
LRLRSGRLAACVAIVAASALGLAACGDDDADATPTATTGTTATAVAGSPTGAASPAPTTAGETPAATATPVVFAPTFTCAAPVAPLEARLYRGQSVEVQGRVFGVMDRNGDAVLAVGAPMDALLRVEVVIPAGSRAGFPADPLLGFANREVCVKGPVTEVGGIITIAATSPAEITVVE